MGLFTKQSFKKKKKALTGLNTRHKAISNNIANADTPNYKRKYVTFRNELKSALGNHNDLEVTNKRHISIHASNLDSVQPKVAREENTSFRNDGNNVSVEHEMAELAKNSLEYRSLVKQISNQFKRLDSVIQQGGNS